MPFFKITTEPSAEIHYEVIPQVLSSHTLFIHGNLASNRWWHPTAELLQRHASREQNSGSMIMAEFRGCGSSSAPRDESEVEMSRFADDFIALARTLATERQIHGVNLVGHSTGGLIVALMLQRAPELFHRALLLDPVGANGVRFDPAMIGAFEAMKQDKNLTAVILGSTIYKNDPQSDFFRQVIVEDAYKAVQTVGHWVLKALDGLNVRAFVSEIQHPVLVLHGEYDTLLPRHDSETLAALLPRGEFRLLEDQGHCANIENPAKFVNILRNFIGENSAAL